MNPLLGFPDIRTYLRARSKPDLTVSSISWSPTSPVEDGTITFTVTIENQGIVSFTSSFKVAYYIDDVKKGEWTIYSLSAGSTTTKTFTWAAVYGSHTVKRARN